MRNTVRVPDEIALICAYATRGRPNARVGGLSAAELKGLDPSGDYLLETPPGLPNTSHRP